MGPGAAVLLGMTRVSGGVAQHNHLGTTCGRLLLQHHHIIIIIIIIMYGPGYSSIISIRNGERNHTKCLMDPREIYNSISCKYQRYCGLKSASKFDMCKLEEAPKRHGRREFLGGVSYCVGLHLQMSCL
jgi:hypothetical protein